MDGWGGGGGGEVSRWVGILTVEMMIMSVLLLKIYLQRMTKEIMTTVIMIWTRMSTVSQERT